MLKKIAFFTALLGSCANIYAHTMEEALAIAYENNNSLKASQEQLKVADENIMQAFSGFLPNVTYKKSRTEATTRNTLATGNNGSTYDIGTRNRTAIGSELSIKQNLFNSGASVANLKKAKDLIEKQRATYRLSEAEILLSAIAAYTKVASLQEQLEICNQRVQTSMEYLESIEAKFAAGEETKSNVAQVKANLSQDIADRIIINGALEAARANYETSFTIAPQNVAMPDGVVLIPANAEEAIAISKKKNAQIVAAQSDYSAADNDITMAKGNLLPSADISHQWSDDRRDPTSSYSRANVTTLSVTVPIFDGGASWSKLRQAKRAAQAYKYTSLNTQQAVIDRTVAAFSDYESRKAAIAAREDQLEAAKVAYEGMLEEQKAGVRSSFDVIIQQNRYFAAKMELVKSKEELLVSRYQLKATIGELSAQDLKLKVKFFNPLQNYNKINWQLIGAF